MNVSISEDPLFYVLSHVQIKQVYVCYVVILCTVKRRAREVWLIYPQYAIVYLCTCGGGNDLAEIAKKASFICFRRDIPIRGVPGKRVGDKRSKFFLLYIRRYIAYS